jgi:Phosphofructokinase
MKIGVLTGGGDCPGLNAVIRAIVRKGTFHYEDGFVGFMEGWRGLLEDKTMELDLFAVGGILPRGGTILRTSRTNPAKYNDGLRRCSENLRRHNCEALIAIGGDDTLSVAQKLFENGINVVGVPKTIDNDLSGTDFTFGFDTAVNIATEAIDRVHTTAEAHNRVIVVEVMGRDSGWIAAYSGIAGGADVILVPEVPFDVDQAQNLPMETRNTAGPSLCKPEKMNSGTRGWVGSARPWPPKSKSAPASNRGRWCLGTFNGADRLPRMTECWLRVMDWAPSIWCTAPNLARWRRSREIRLFRSRCWTPSPRIAR